MENNAVHVWTVWHPVVSADTFGIHRDIFFMKDNVYWGVIHDDEYPKEYLGVLDEFLPKLRQQLENSVPTSLFISHLDPQTDFFAGSIREIKKGAEFAGWENSELVPEYYKNLKPSRDGISIDYWFLLSSFDIIDHSVFKNVRPIGYPKLDRSKFGKAGKPYPCACDFEGQDEGNKGIDRKATIRAKELLEENVFRFETDYWRVIFNGKPYSIKQSVGIQYITHLIQRAYNQKKTQEIHVSDLYYLVNKMPAVEETHLSKMSREQLSEMGLDVSELGEGLDLMTPEGKKWADDQLKELRYLIEEAEKTGNTAEALRVRKIKEQLEDYVQKAVGLFGRVRKSADLNEKMRKSVSKTIEYTDEIGADSRTLFCPVERTLLELVLVLCV